MPKLFLIYTPAALQIHCFANSFFIYIAKKYFNFGGF